MCVCMCVVVVVVVFSFFLLSSPALVSFVSVGAGGIVPLKCKTTSRPSRQTEEKAAQY